MALPEIFFLATYAVPLTPPFFAGIIVGLAILATAGLILSIFVCAVSKHRGWRFGVPITIGIAHGLGIRFTSFIIWNMVG